MIHLKSIYAPLGSVNFIDAWQVHENFVNLTKKLGILINLTEKVSNRVCKQKFTPANSYSVPHGNSVCEKVVKILIQMGARLNIKDGDGQAPIHLAILKRRSSIAAMLVKNGVSLKTRNQDGLTPLECALKNSLRCIKVLLYGGIML